MLKHLGDGRYEGVLADRPAASAVPVGAEFTETDTLKKSINSGTEWIPYELPTHKTYTVIKINSNYYILDKHKKPVQGPGSDVAALMNAHLATMPVNSSWEFVWDAEAFTMENPIIIPSISGGQVKMVRMIGSGYVAQRVTSGGVTNLIPSATFPLNRYIFELNNPGAATLTTGMVNIERFQCTNSGNFTRQVGFCKLESGTALSALQNAYIVRDVHTSYLWRTLHLIGRVQYGTFSDIAINSPNAAFVGDADFILEDGGHTDVTINPSPKVNRFENLRVSRGPSLMNCCIRIKSGGYNRFRNVQIDGHTYVKAAADLDNTDTLTIHNNTFDNLQLLDLNGVDAVDVREAALYLAGNCNDNWFNNSRIYPYPVSVKLVGSGVTRNHIEMDAYWGVTSSVTDTGTDGTNVIKVKAGAKTTPGDSKITHVGGMSRIIDERQGSEKGGVTTGRTDGSTIAHGLFATPAWYFVTGTVAGEIVTATADATNLTLGIKTHTGAAGTSQSVSWRAGVYA